MKHLPLALFATISFGSLCPVVAQEAARKTADLPIFQTLVGKRSESGILIPQANGQPIPGKAISLGQSALGGLWFQIDGRAEYGPVVWEYRWMFLFNGSGGKNAVFATYIDTMGQRINYEGLYDEENSRVQLIAKLQDGGTGRYQLSLEEPGIIQISSVHADKNDDPQVTYSAQNAEAK